MTKISTSAAPTHTRLYTLTPLMCQQNETRTLKAASSIVQVSVPELHAKQRIFPSGIASFICLNIQFD